MKRKPFLLLTTLVIAALVLSGCGVSREGVDITTTPPDNLWQTLVVWPLGHALIWIDGLLRSINAPYHWGFAIIIFTLLIKVITFPLTISQIRGMQAQKELQPKIQALQKKYGKDREKLSQEQMKLYQEAGVNPLSGCLPLLVQMPVLFGLYSALVAIGPSMANASFFWIPDLAFPQYSAGLSWIAEAWSAGDYVLLVQYLILPVLLMASQFVMQKWMTPATPQSSDSDNPMGGMTKQLTLMMTFMFGFFTLQVPAGLTLYWVTSNLLQMLQQWLIMGERFGLGANPKLAATTAGAGTTDLPAKQTSSTNGTKSTNGAEPDETIATRPSEEKAAKAREPRRRRAKRR